MNPIPAIALIICIFYALYGLVMIIPELFKSRNDEYPVKRYKKAKGAKDNIPGNPHTKRLSEWEKTCKGFDQWEW